MSLHWPQLTLLIIVALRLGLVLALDGEPTNSKYDFWRSAGRAAGFIILLACGGFFR